MKKLVSYVAYSVCAMAIALLSTSCLTIHATKKADIPAVDEYLAMLAAKEVKEIEKEPVSNFYFSTDDVPVIDGKFDEWKGLDGVHTRQQVYGGAFNPENADGLFVARTDGANLYIYADITDNDPSINEYEVPQAWRGDGVEFFFGTDTKNHTQFIDSDVRVRLVPRSKSDIKAVSIGINDTEVESEDIEAAVVYSSKGYKVEAKFPLSLLGGNKNLKQNQKVRVDYQINDADDGKERTGLLHWNRLADDTYANPSGWGNGVVVPLSK